MVIDGPGQCRDAGAHDDFPLMLQQDGTAAISRKIAPRYAVLAGSVRHAPQTRGAVPLPTTEILACEKQLSRDEAGRPGRAVISRKTALAEGSKSAQKTLRGTSLWFRLVVRPRRWQRPAWRFLWTVSGPRSSQCEDRPPRAGQLLEGSMPQVQGSACRR